MCVPAPPSPCGTGVQERTAAARHACWCGTYLARSPTRFSFPFLPAMSASQQPSMCCPICYVVRVRQPTTLACTHTFCWACIRLWASQTPRPTCPLCGAPLDADADLPGLDLPRSPIPVDPGLWEFMREQFSPLSQLVAMYPSIRRWLPEPSRAAWREARGPAPCFDDHWERGLPPAMLAPAPAAGAAAGVAVDVVGAGGGPVQRGAARQDQHKQPKQPKQPKRPKQAKWPKRRQRQRQPWRRLQ